MASKHIAQLRITPELLVSWLSSGHLCRVTENPLPEDVAVEGGYFDKLNGQFVLLLSSEQFTEGFTDTGCGFVIPDVPKPRITAYNPACYVLVSPQQQEAADKLAGEVGDSCVSNCKCCGDVRDALEVYLKARWE